MPEKTRDRKNWFPRFKSNWLGTYRSKQMFLCCECAVTDAESARYKGAEGKHCACGRDQWHLAKSVEEAEYNRRMEISKSFGGIRYEEAVERIKGMGGSAVNGEYTSELDDHRVRCGSDESSASTMSVHSSDSVDFGHHTHKRIKTETQSLSPTSRNGAFSHELKLSMGSNAYGYDHHQLNQPQPYKSYHSSSNSNSYAPLPADTMLSSSPYDHLAPPAFTDEESFGELLQGILEDDPRNPHNSHHAKMASHGARAAPYQPYAHMKRYAEPLSTQQQTQAADMDFGYYQNSGYQSAHHHHHHTQSQQQTSHHGYSGYHQPHSFHHHQHMVPPVATASFPSAV